MNEAQLARFLPKVQPDDLGECLIWTASRQPSGYGVFGLTSSPQKNVRAHRAAYEHWRGPIPDGLVIDHLCRVRSCVNPWHMEPVPQATNIRRGQSPAAQQGRLTHCREGHPFAGDNLIMDNGHRRCRECRNRQYREWYARTH